MINAKSLSTEILTGTITTYPPSNDARPRACNVTS